MGVRNIYSLLQKVKETKFPFKICSANQLTGFYMMATLAFNELTLE